MHFTPTSASWINQVERFFALLTDRALSRGILRSVAELEAAVRAYIDAHNADLRPFRWTKTADDILASIKALLPSDAPSENENDFRIRTLENARISMDAFCQDPLRLRRRPMMDDRRPRATSRGRRNLGGWGRCRLDPRQAALAGDSCA
jgi:hypothetical protein